MTEDDDPTLTGKLMDQARVARDKWLDDRHFKYVMGMGTTPAGFVMSCHDCGALVAVPRTRDVLKDLGNAYKHWRSHHPKPPLEPNKLYRPPGVYCDPAAANE